MEQDAAAAVESHNLILWNFVKTKSTGASKMGRQSGRSPNPFIFFTLDGNLAPIVAYGQEQGLCRFYTPGPVLSRGFVRIGPPPFA